MSKIRDGASMQREINRATVEDRRRRIEQARKNIRDKLQQEIEKARLKKVERSG